MVADRGDRPALVAVLDCVGAVQGLDLDDEAEILVWCIAEGTIASRAGAYVGHGAIKDAVKRGAHRDGKVDPEVEKGSAGIDVVALAGRRIAGAGQFTPRRAAKALRDLPAAVRRDRPAGEVAVAYGRRSRKRLRVGGGQALAPGAARVRARRVGILLRQQPGYQRTRLARAGGEVGNRGRKGADAVHEAKRVRATGGAGDGDSDGTPLVGEIRAALRLPTRDAGGVLAAVTLPPGAGDGAAVGGEDFSYVGLERPLDVKGFAGALVLRVEHPDMHHVPGPPGDRPGAIALEGKA